MLAYTDGADTWATATMRNTEGFVQVEVGYIATKLTWLTDTDHRIEVGTIDINLTTMIVNDLTDFFNTLFKHAMSRRIGNHNRSQILAVSRRFLF